MEIDRSLLRDLYLLDGKSGKEYEIASFVINYLNNVNNITFELGPEGNLFITKNSDNPEFYPCVVAHMDTIQSFKKPRSIFINKNNLLTAHYIDDKTQCGLNADDRNGVCIALQLLKEMPNLKVVLTTQEESGGIGAYTASNNIEFFLNVRYILQADRRGNSDLITHTNGIDVASDDFINDISEIMSKYGYKEAIGTFTDVGILVSALKISGVNISCGYYNEHTNKESCKLDELNNCLNFMYETIIKLDENNKIYIAPKNTYGTFTNGFISQFPYDFPTDDDFYEEKSIKNFIEDPCRCCYNMDCMHCKIFPY